MRHHFILAEFFQAYDELTPNWVGYNLNLSFSKITSLGNLEWVGFHDLILVRTKVKSLGKLKHIGGSLFIADTNISSFSNLAYVGNAVYCDRGKLYDKLKSVNFNNFEIITL